VVVCQVAADEYDDGGRGPRGSGSRPIVDSGILGSDKSFQRHVTRSGIAEASTHVITLTARDPFPKMRAVTQED
jgi:hypothetical protein